MSKVSKSSSIRRTTLNSSYVEGSFYAAMVATAECFALYYIVSRGIPAHQTALLTTLPMLLGALSHWIMPLLFRGFLLKAGVLSGVAIQIVGLICLVVSTFQEDHFFWVLAALSLYWIGGMGSHPLWIEWISLWLPSERFGRFFSRRNSFLSLITLILFWATSGYLYQSEAGGAEIDSVFLVVFLFALTMRLVSLGMLFLQSSPPSIVSSVQAPSSKPQLSWWTVGLIIGFSALFKFVANLASPFFLPYMIEELGMNVVEVSLTNGMSFLGLALLMTSFGESLKSFQPVTGLLVAMLGATLVSFCWVLTRDLFSIATIQFFAGVIWAGFDLSGILILQYAFTRGFAPMIGLHLCVGNLMGLAGSLVGSSLLESEPFLQVFTLSAFGRLVVALVFGCGVFVFFREVKVPVKSLGLFVKSSLVMRLTFAHFHQILPAQKKRSRK